MFNRNHKGQRTLKIMITAMILGGATAPSLVQADTLEALKEERLMLNEEMKSLEESIEKTEKQIERMESRFELLEDQISETKEAIKEVKERIEVRREIIENRLSALQANGGKISYLEVLFNSQSFGDFVNRVSTVSTIAKSDQALLEIQKEDQLVLSQQEEKLTDRVHRLEDQFRALQEKQSELESKKAEQELLSLDLDDKIKAEEEREYWKNYASLQNRSFANLSISDLGKSYQDLSEEEKKAMNESTYEEKQSIIKTAINEGSKHIGKPYVWGGSTPETSFDCSGLTQWAFKQAGIDLDRTAAQQYMQSEKVASEDVKVGDLVFFSYGSGISHVGIYVGDGKMLNAQNSGVMIADLSGHWEQYVVGFGRVPGL